MSVTLRFGDIVDMSVMTVDEYRKVKIVVCVEPDEFWFFYINSRLYKQFASSAMELQPYDLERLTHKSYLDLHKVNVASCEEIASIKQDKIFRFNNDSIYKNMMFFIKNAREITPIQKRKIKEAYEKEFGPL